MVVVADVEEVAEPVVTMDVVGVVEVVEVVHCMVPSSLGSVPSSPDPVCLLAGFVSRDPPLPVVVDVPDDEVVEVVVAAAFVPSLYWPVVGWLWPTAWDCTSAALVTVRTTSTRTDAPASLCCMSPVWVSFAVKQWLPGIPE